MIKNALILIGVLIPAGLYSQIPAGGNISISVCATIVSESPVELTTLSNITLDGEINDNREIYVSPLTSPNAGLMMAKGKPGSQARIIYLLSEILTDNSGKGFIKINYEMSSNSDKIQKASTLIEKGEATLNFNNQGICYLWVGGKINTSRAKPGKYTGQFTIEMEYL